mmetsp:Transcript_53375/g.129837  ORF Transcript_53375/g.129837 Transcript_53375/m.129837 type:complete len:127 (-) Transcript_53375:397-777(-)
MVQTIVRPPSCASRRSNATTSSAVRLSSPLVGSSRNRTGGRVINASPMFTRFACPPEIPLDREFPITVCRHDSKSSIAMTSLTRLVRSAGVNDVGNFNSAVYFSIFSTVNSPTNVSNCSTYPTPNR